MPIMFSCALCASSVKWLGATQMPSSNYFFKACFRPNSLDAFEGFDVGIDGQGKGRGYATAWHKAEWSQSPYSVFNELICGELGRFIRLPVPPFAVTYHEADGSKPLFSSLDFNNTRDTLPPIIPESCVERVLPLCAGILVFDIFIANRDRHDENLLADNADRPKAMHVFDHDQALLGGSPAYPFSGIERLEKTVDRLGITGSSITGGHPHVFLPLITTCKPM